jgi:hypothetical protein
MQKFQVETFVVRYIAKVCSTSAIVVVVYSVLRTQDVRQTDACWLPNSFRTDFKQN